tara:strand:- start:32105 stop:32410 length:306 start_codon:yes stop_codon:yes gene_type:complete
MARNVIISKIAERRLENLFEFLLDNWSVKVKNDFIIKLEKCVTIIRKQPESFPSSEKEQGLRKCVITKHTTLFYRFDEKSIKIVTLFDSRQNPKKLNQDIK